MENSTLDTITESKGNRSSNDNMYDSNYISNHDSNDKIKKTEIPGSYKNKAFFAHDTVGNIFEDEYVYELELYEDILEESTTFADDMNYLMYTYRSGTLPTEADVFFPLKSYYGSYLERTRRNSTVYTPVFTQDTYIDGNAHFRLIKNLYIEGSRPTITFRLRMFDYDPSDNSTVELLSIEEDEPNYNFGGRYRDLVQTFSSPYLIESGHRLIVRYDAKFSHLNYDLMDYGLYCPESWPGSTAAWNIVDGIHSNYYEFNDTRWMLGMQLYLFDSEYPDIIVSGFTNNTVYVNENKNITIGVSEAIESSYRWDGGSYINFESSTWTISPETHG
ncbi:MAG: hypothetical protein ACW96U_06075 [Candidatus Heimdallarchaeaceae archaeon]